jgi:hypothetical protein
MKRLLTTLAQKWPEYLLEMLVITIGILGAFLLNNWNEDLKLKKTANLHLEVLKDNLEDDLIELKQLDSIMDEILASGNELMAQFKGEVPIDQTIYENLTVLIMEYTFIPQSTGINSLKNSGSITILNDELQQQISQYYNSCDKVKERDDISNLFIKDKYEPKIFNEYAFIWNSENPFSANQATYGNDTRPVPPLNSEQFLNDKSLEVLIFARIYQVTAQKAAYVKAINDLNGLIELLSDEIS